MAKVKAPISVVILTFNEEGSIRECLESVAGWADEIVVVDSFSLDRTIEIAKEFTENVYQHHFEDYSKQRNWAQENIQYLNKWVLHLDADERVTPELSEEIVEIFDKGEVRENGFLIKRKTIFLGRWMRFGGLYPTYHLRLFRMECGWCEQRHYDQHFLVKGKVGKLEGDIVNKTSSDLKLWAIRHIEWADAESIECMTDREDKINGVRASLFGTALERRRWEKNNLYYKLPIFLRSFSYFFYRYLIRLGFLDGLEGLIYHFLQGLWFRFLIDALIFESKRKNRNE